jgi:hypothetical protein
MSAQLTEYDEESTLVLLKEFKRSYGETPWALKYERTEDIYPQSIIDAYHQADPLRVDMEYGYLGRFIRKVKPDSPYTRSLERLFEWFEENFQAVLNGEHWELPPVDIIEDDPILLEATLRSQKEGVIIVTNDRKLVRRIENRNAGKIIGRISIENWVEHDADEGAFLSALQERFPNLDWEILVDQGALETFLLKTDINPLRYPAFGEDVNREGIRSQADIYDVYLPPKPLNKSNILTQVEMTRASLFAANSHSGWRPSAERPWSSSSMINRRGEQIEGPLRPLSLVTHLDRTTDSRGRNAPGAYPPSPYRQLDRDANWRRD